MFSVKHDWIILFNTVLLWIKDIKFLYQRIYSLNNYYTVLKFNSIWLFEKAEFDTWEYKKKY